MPCHTQIFKIKFSKKDYKKGKFFFFYIKLLFNKKKI